MRTQWGGRCCRTDWHVERPIAARDGRVLRSPSNRFSRGTAPRRAPVPWRRRAGFAAQRISAGGARSRRPITGPGSVRSALYPRPHVRNSRPPLAGRAVQGRACLSLHGRGRRTLPGAVGSQRCGYEPSGPAGSRRGQRRRAWPGPCTPSRRREAAPSAPPLSCRVTGDAANRRRRRCQHRGARGAAAQ